MVYCCSLPLLRYLAAESLPGLLWEKLLKTCLALLLMLGWVSAQSFAALTVTPLGEQNFDLSTGITTLPEGGEVIDKETGLELSAGFIRYEEGGFIEAESAQVVGEFGALSASTLFVDAKAQRISASGGVELSYNDLALASDALEIYLEPDVVVLEGGVTSETPDFDSERVLIYLKTEQALLVSPYIYVNGPLSLRQAGADKLLQITPQNGTSYSASSTVDEALVGALAPYLERP